MTNNARRALAIAEARTWLGVPFSLVGNNRAGISCGHLIAHAYRAAGIDLPEFESLPRGWHLHSGDERYIAIVERHLHRVENPLPADMAVFQIGRSFGHAGLVIDWPEILHVMEPGKCGNGKVCVEKVDPSRRRLWHAREIRFYSPFTGV